MATFHCSVKSGKSGSGGAHADYIERDGKYKSKSKDDLEHVERGNMPEFASQNPSEFWKAADEYERANGAAYREFEIALPRELTKDQRLELVREFVAQEIGGMHAYTFAIHNPAAAIDGGEQPHAHIMFSERTNDGINRPADQYFKRWNAKNPEKGGCKKANTAKTPTERKAELVQLRERFAELQNKHLAKAGHEVRVTHLSLAAQGIEREVEPHLGPKLAKELASAIKTDRAAVPRTPEKPPESPNVGTQPIRIPKKDPLKPAKTALEAPETPKPPNPTDSEIQAAVELFSRVGGEMKGQRLQREAKQREVMEASGKAEQARAKAEWRAKLAIEENKRLGDRPRLITGKWDKAHEVLKAQFNAAKADEAKAQESLKELAKQAEALKAQPTLDERIKAAIVSLKLPYTQQTLDQIQLGTQVLKERQQQLEQTKAVSQVKSQEQENER